MKTTEFLKLLKDPPASDKNLSYLYEHVLLNNFKNICVTINTFPGAGKVGEVRYLISELVRLKRLQTNHLFFFTDLSHLEDDEDNFFRSSVVFCQNVFRKSFDPKTDAVFVDLLRGSVPESAFSSLLYFLTFECGYNITLIVDSSEVLFEQNGFSKKASDVLKRAKDVNPAKISYLFFTDGDGLHTSKSDLGSLSLDFYQHIIDIKDVLFSRECAERLIKNQINWHNHSFSKVFVQNVGSLTYGDPTVAKQCVLRAMADPTFEKFLSSEEFDSETALVKHTPYVYSFIGEDWLNIRYQRILNSLSSENVGTLLKRKNSSLPESLGALGLVFDDSGLILNPLFTYFLSQYYTKEDSRIDLSQVLTAKEFMIYKTLLENKEKVVDKDRLAESMWGDDWENQYSEWSIDKHISTLRKKLLNSGSTLTIRSMRGRGYLLG